MRWLLVTALVVCCVSVQADELQDAYAAEPAEENPF